MRKVKKSIAIIVALAMLLTSLPVVAGYQAGNEYAPVEAASGNAPALNEVRFGGTGFAVFPYDPVNDRWELYSAGVGGGAWGRPQGNGNFMYSVRFMVDNAEFVERLVFDFYLPANTLSPANEPHAAFRIGISPLPFINPALPSGPQLLPNQEIWGSSNWNFMQTANHPSISMLFQGSTVTRTVGVNVNGRDYYRITIDINTVNLLDSVLASTPGPHGHLYQRMEGFILSINSRAWSPVGYNAHIGNPRVYGGPRLHDDYVHTASPMAWAGGGFTPTNLVPRGYIIRPSLPDPVTRQQMFDNQHIDIRIPAAVAGDEAGVYAFEFDLYIPQNATGITDRSLDPWGEGYAGAGARLELGVLLRNNGVRNPANTADGTGHIPNQLNETFWRSSNYWMGGMNPGRYNLNHPNILSRTDVTIGGVVYDRLRIRFVDRVPPRPLDCRMIINEQDEIGFFLRLFMVTPNPVYIGGIRAFRYQPAAVLPYGLFLYENAGFTGTTGVHGPNPEVPITITVADNPAMTGGVPTVAYLITPGNPASGTGNPVFQANAFRLNPDPATFPSGRGKNNISGVTYTAFVPATIRTNDSQPGPSGNPAHLRFDWQILPISSYYMWAPGHVMDGARMIFRSWITPYPYITYPVVSGFYTPDRWRGIVPMSGHVVTGNPTWVAGPQHNFNTADKLVWIDGVPYMRIEQDIEFHGAGWQKDEIILSVSTARIGFTTPIFVSDIQFRFDQNEDDTLPTLVVPEVIWLNEDPSTGISIRDISLITGPGNDRDMVATARGTWGGNQERFVATEEGLFAAFGARYSDEHFFDNAYGHSTPWPSAFFFQPAHNNPEGRWFVLEYWKDNGEVPIVVSDAAGNVYVQLFVNITDPFVYVQSTATDRHYRPAVVVFEAGSWDFDTHSFRSGMGLTTHIWHDVFLNEPDPPTHAQPFGIANAYISGTINPVTGKLYHIAMAQKGRWQGDRLDYMDIVRFCPVTLEWEHGRLWWEHRLTYFWHCFDAEGNLEIIALRSAFYEQVGWPSEFMGAPGQSRNRCGLRYYRISKTWSDTPIYWCPIGCGAAPLDPTLPFTIVGPNSPNCRHKNVPQSGQTNWPRAFKGGQFLVIMDEITFAAACPQHYIERANAGDPYYMFWRDTANYVFIHPVMNGDMFWDPDTGDIHVFYQRRSRETMINVHTATTQMWHAMLRRNPDGSRYVVFDVMLFPSTSHHHMFQNYAGDFFIINAGRNSTVIRLYKATAFCDTGWTWTHQGTFEGLPFPVYPYGFSPSHRVGQRGVEVDSNGNVYIDVMYASRNAFTPANSGGAGGEFAVIRIFTGEVAGTQQPVPEFGWSIFNNGEGGSPSTPNAGLAEIGVIRMWTMLDGVGAPVYLAATNTIVALDQDENCAMEFVRVGRVWSDDYGWQNYFNLLDVNKNGDWEYINLYITVYGKVVHALLVNALFTEPATEVIVTFVVEAGAVGVYAETTSYVELLAGEAIPVEAIPSVVARPGFYFVEWYPSDPAEFGYVTEDVTFTARFNLLFHYVTFEAGQGGELVPTDFGLVVRIRDGFTFWADRVPTPVANDGYEFVNWYPYNPAGFVVRKDMTFTAVFAEAAPVVPQIISVTNPAIVQQGGVVEITVLTQGMPDGAWVDLNVTWRPGLSVVGGPRFYIVDGQATITVAAAENARIGRDGFSVAARAAGDWGIPFIIDSYTFVIEVVQ